MVALLVVLTVVICLLFDWLMRPQNTHQTPPIWIRSNNAFRDALGAELAVEGFRLREGLYFHPGHMWVFAEGPNRVRIGMDDFACQLSNPLSKIELPQIEQVLTQGAPAFRLFHNGQVMNLSAPIGGCVIAVNRAVAQTPQAINRDPFAAWLAIVQSSDLQTELNNLMSGDLVFVWTVHEAVRLRTRKRVGLSPDPDFLHTFFRGETQPR